MHLPGRHKSSHAVHYGSALPTMIALSLVVSSCTNERPYTKETFVMGTKASVTIYGLSDERAESAASDALRELHRVESVMSTWKKDSEISRLNKHPTGTPFRVSDELLSMIDSSLFYSKVTSGGFDITAYPLVRLWGFSGGIPRLPGGGEIERALALVGYEKIMIRRDSSTVTLAPGMSIDLAGIAKGYGVDRCVSILKENGVGKALVNLGGNIYALGAPPGRDGWSIGIRDPLGGTGIVGSLLLRDEAAATSGNYENFVEIEGERYGHIMDPHSGKPVRNVLSVTVVAPTALASDALSTGLFVRGIGDAREIVDTMSGVRAIFAVPCDMGICYTILGENTGISGLP
jgi:thiamine biosynthesis lipoprotein